MKRIYFLLMMILIAPALGEAEDLGTYCWEGYVHDHMSPSYQALRGYRINVSRQGDYYSLTGEEIKYWDEYDDIESQELISGIGHVKFVEKENKPMFFLRLQNYRYWRFDLENLEGVYCDGLSCNEGYCVEWCEKNLGVLHPKPCNELRQWDRWSQW